MTKPKPQPGQLDLTGRVTPADRIHPVLRRAGFRIHDHGGVVYYGDPFRPHLRLSVSQAKRLLADRQKPVPSGGYRLRYPASGFSEIRLGHRRATMEGAWHDMHASSGQRKAPQGYWIVDGSGARVWPNDQEEPGLSASD
jgi:hypothetical protein